MAKVLTQKQLDKQIEKRNKEIRNLRLEIARLSRDNAADHVRKLSLMGAKNIVKKAVKAANKVAKNDTA